MNTQMISDRSFRPPLRAMSRALQDVHRSLIDFSRERYELANGPVRTRSQLLGLLLDDEAFTWLRPLSGLIAEIDELAARDVAPRKDETTDIGNRAAAFFASSDDPNTFGSRYIALIASEPRVAMNHGELRAALARVREPAA